MEQTVRATFVSMTALQKAAARLKRDGVIDLRLEGNTGSTLPDDVEFALEPLASAMNTTAQQRPHTLLVSVERSRYRQAEDTIAACGGTIVTEPN
ncbi:hypothetical protein ACFFK0_00605 [Paenibacillus chartarius]|uniref:Uncharacterized protein n=1 Tax=Paenibacillus chartarius TaxID=747481 RepID=A0ABV6DE86_9BACL